MNKIFRITLVLSVAFSTRIFAEVPFEQTNMKSFADWNPDTTGSTVVTEKLQSAVDWAQENSATLYIPPGNYLIDKIIEARVLPSRGEPHKSPNICGDAYQPPTIKLKDQQYPDAPNDARNAVPMIRLRNSDPSRKAPWNYFCTLQNVIFDVGNNPGAAGVEWGAHQDSHMMNVTVRGEAFATGFLGVLGANQMNLNLRVEGGEYGVYVNDNGSVGYTFSGLTLMGQSKSGILVDNWRGCTIAGFEYSGPGPAVTCMGNSSYEQGNLYLQDAKINLSNADVPAIRVEDGRSLVMRNVYIKGTLEPVRASPQGVSADNDSDWIFINDFANVNPEINGRPALIFQNDTRVTSKTIASTSTIEIDPPHDLLSRHLPEETFAFNHPEAINALEYPGESGGERIQNALNGPARVVYVPAGVHELPEGIVIPPGKALVGDPGKYSELKPIYVPEDSERFVVSTADTNLPVHIWNFIIANRDMPNDGGWHWRAAKGDLGNIRVMPGNGIRENRQTMMKLTGLAGGKFYGISDHRNLLNGIDAISVNYRKVLIDGTRNPISFYGMNLERGGAQRGKPANPWLEIRDAQNVRIFGMKSETDEGPTIRLVNAKNILLSFFITHRSTLSHFLEILPDPDEESQIEVAFMMGGNREENPPHPLVLPDYNIVKRDILVRLRMGLFDDSRFAAETDVSDVPEIKIVGGIVTGASGDFLRIRWSAEARSIYKVQTSDDLEAWKDYSEEIIGDSTTKVEEIPVTTGKKYARIIQI